MFSTATSKSSFLEIVSYTIPKLYTGKCWYIGFNAFDPATGKMRQHRIKLNHIEKIGDRRKYAAGLMFRLTKQLENGWNPFIEAEHSKAYHTFKDVCGRYSAYVTKLYNDGNFREKTMYGYLSMLRTFEKWNSKRIIPITYIYQFDRLMVTEFLNYIYMDENNSIRTRNNYLTWLSVFDGYLVQNMYLKCKVTEGIVAIRRNTSEKDRDVIAQKDLVRLKDYLDKENKYFQLANYLLYYAMVRPKEMSYLKLEYFNVKNQTLFIPGIISKNRKSGSVGINKKIFLLMLELGTFKNPSSDYLFSTNFKPGPTYKSERYLRDYWNDHVRKDLNFPKRYKFYSLKDTGITDALRNNCDVISVRDQARHSSIMMTNTYTPQNMKEASEIMKNYDGIF